MVFMREEDAKQGFLLAFCVGLTGGLCVGRRMSGERLFGLARAEGPF